jgi:hypothetical protein
MKKLSLFISTLFILSFYSKLQAQSLQSSIYKTSAGLSVEFGDGGTIVGPAIKHYFDVHNALQGELLFGQGATFVSAFYHYNGSIQNAKGLNYYFGAGPALAFATGSTLFFIRPTAGLDYKISDTPLDLSFDWRPTFYVGSGSTFIAARFGLGLRFCF